MRSEESKEQQRDYTRTMTKQYSLRLNRKTDKDLIEWIEGKENRQGYIKDLIRDDMEKTGK